MRISDWSSDVCSSDLTADWLFSISDGRGLPGIDGLVAVENYERSGRPPEEVAIMEKAHSYGARAVFFEAERNGRAPVPQAFIFDANDGLDDANFAEQIGRASCRERVCQSV